MMAMALALYFIFHLHDQRKPLNTSNGFGVQLTKTISTTQWFLHSF